jgi:hypothetical protein
MHIRIRIDLVIQASLRWMIDGSTSRGRQLFPFSHLKDQPFGGRLYNTLTNRNSHSLVTDLVTTCYRVLCGQLRFIAESL